MGVHMVYEIIYTYALLSIHYPASDWLLYFQQWYVPDPLEVHNELWKMTVQNFHNLIPGMPSTG